MLTQMGIHHIENAKLDELADDKVWTSCTMILPLREKARRARRCGRWRSACLQRPGSDERRAVKAYFIQSDSPGHVARAARRTAAPQAGNGQLLVRVRARASTAAS